MPRGPKPRPITDAERESVVRMYKEGCSWREIRETAYTDFKRMERILRGAGLMGEKKPANRWWLKPQTPAAS